MTMFTVLLCQLKDTARAQPVHQRQTEELSLTIIDNTLAITLQMVL